MNDSFTSPEPEKEPNSIINILIAGIGVILMLCACSLLPIIVIRNSANKMVASGSTAAPAVGNEEAAYTGTRIREAAAGAKEIEALAYSSQMPVVVMFDADW